MGYESLPARGLAFGGKMSRSCIVIGAGPAGLSAAFRLANAGVRVTVLEQGAAVGGRTRSERVGDFVVNTGATLIPGFSHATLGLLREFNLAVVEPRERSAVSATPVGKFPLDIGSARALWRFPLVPWHGKLRAAAALAWMFLGRRSDVADLAGLARLDRTSTLDAWGRRVLGASAYDYLLRTAVESWFYGDAGECSAAVGKAFLRQALQWRVHVVAEGTGALCEALARRVEVRTGCAAVAVEASPDRVTVVHSGGTLDADYALLAVPASTAARLEGIAEEDRTALAQVRYVPSIALFFGYERPVTVQYHSVTPSGPGRHAIAGIWTMSRWIPQYVPQGRELMAIYSSGWRAAELLESDPARVAALLRADAEEVFGRLADPDWIRMYPRREAKVLAVPGHFRRMQEFLRRPRPRLLFAGDWLAGSTVEGSVRSGLAAAERIIAAGEER